VPSLCSSHSRHTRDRPYRRKVLAVPFLTRLIGPPPSSGSGPVAHSLYHAALFLYASVAAVMFGATVYETVVVHPAWSRQIPASLDGFNSIPASRLNLPAFWVPAAPILVLSALLALGAAIAEGRATAYLITSVVSAVAAVVWTLVYFRPNVTRFITDRASIPPERLAPAVRRWIVFNWFRLALVTLAWLGVLHAL
jgi:hypothetical protein